MVIGRAPESQIRICDDHQEGDDTGRLKPPSTRTNSPTFVPVEMRKVRIAQKLALSAVERRLAAIMEAGNNTSLLRNSDVCMDMLTDSGVNAMNDLQAAMVAADDSYSATHPDWRARRRKSSARRTSFLPTGAEHARTSCRSCWCRRDPWCRPSGVAARQPPAHRRPHASHSRKNRKFCASSMAA